VGYGEIWPGEVGFGMQPLFRRVIIWLSEILCNRDWWATPILRGLIIKEDKKWRMK